jgi:hypothetical protein
MIEYLDNILNYDFNKTLINELQTANIWRISPDENDEGIPVGDEYSDTGMLSLSYKKDSFPNSIEKELTYSFFNVSAYYIFNSILSNSSYKFYNVSLDRYLWNYYNKSSTGVDHVDNPKDNYYSIVYYLNDSDGGTVVDNKFYQSVSNRALLFKSNILHKGIGPKNYKARYVLNITFSADNYERK